MKKNLIYKFCSILIISIYILLMYSCENKNRNTSNDSSDSEKLDIIKLVETEDMQSLDKIDYQKSKLDIEKIYTEKMDKDSVILSVKYDIRDFSLSEKTHNENPTTITNPHEGQHIHFILDNKAYEALYFPEHSIKLKKETKHYLLSFLSGSHHVSLKHPESFELRHFEISPKGKYIELPIEASPMMFYSRPKGEYIGSDCKSILLDFFLVNTNLGENGNKVKAEINEHVFYIDSWQSYQIEGLPMGETTISLTLVDNKNVPISGEFNTTTRKIMLQE